MQTRNNKVMTAVIRGIFDTDGGVSFSRLRTKTKLEWERTHYYMPKICITSCSKILLEQIQFLLTKLNITAHLRQAHTKGFKNSRNINNSYALDIWKKSEVEKWIDIIGSNNPRHKTKFDIWKKFGHLPPRTTLKERMLILNT